MSSYQIVIGYINVKRNEYLQEAKEKYPNDENMFHLLSAHACLVGHLSAMLAENIDEKTLALMKEDLERAE